MSIHIKSGPVGDDPHSFANFNECITTDVSLHLKANFESKSLTGHALYVVKQVQIGKKKIKLDFHSNQIEIHSISSEDGSRTVPYGITGTSKFGDCIELDLSFIRTAIIDSKKTAGSQAQQEDLDRIKISYTVHTTGYNKNDSKPLNSAISWLTCDQTTGKKHPFAFTSAQAILARTFLPCQDTPAVKFNFECFMEVDVPLVVVCSGVLKDIYIAQDSVEGGRKSILEGFKYPSIHDTTQNEVANEGTQDVGDTEVATKTRVFHYKVCLPIPAYLIAFVIGRLERRHIGTFDQKAVCEPTGPGIIGTVADSVECHVYAEPENMAASAKEFSGICDKYIKAAVQVLDGFPYQWGPTYDICVMPNNFKFGGMENPNVTFVTGSLIAGDQSLTTTLAHEIVHSWTGNLVTNKFHKDFWLNEGFTRYLERRVLCEIFGVDFRGLVVTVGYKDLCKNVEMMQGIGQGKFTSLEPFSIAEVDPDEAFSRVPYEKGHLFLYYLEHVIIESPKLMAQWLTAYLKAFSGGCVETKDMKSHFLEFFTDNEMFMQILMQNPIRDSANVRERGKFVYESGIVEVLPKPLKRMSSLDPGGGKDSGKEPEEAEDSAKELATEIPTGEVSKSPTDPAGLTPEEYTSWEKEARTKVATRLDEIEWEIWLHGEGLPEYRPRVNLELITSAEDLVGYWLLESQSVREQCIAEDLAGQDIFMNPKERPISVISLKGETFFLPDWKAQQKMLMLDLMMGQEKFPFSVLKVMEKFYKFAESQNVEILFRWLLIQISLDLFADWWERMLGRKFPGGISATNVALKDALQAQLLEQGNCDGKAANNERRLLDPHAAKMVEKLDWFLGFHGRGTYVKPLYLGLKKHGCHDLAQILFTRHKSFYQLAVANMLEKVLA